MKYYDRTEGVVAWQPSTWPEAPSTWSPALGDELRGIVDESILDELEKVIGDAMHANGDLRHRGHVIGLSLFCAVDAVSAYGYFNEPNAPPCTSCGKPGEKIGPRYKAFVRAHFPRGYAAFADELYGAYRCSTVHSWHLFKVAILPGSESIAKRGGIVSFGLLDFFAALKEAVYDFFEKLKTDAALQTSTLKRYSDLRNTAE